jgi:predicted AlkP superfamily pyrophosphatase or phosphodiesterase
MSNTVPADYDGGGLVNLMRSVVEGLGGGSTPYAPLQALPPTEVAAADHLIVWLVDGLGYDYLRSQGSSSALLQHLRSPMSSVFPATTASAITTLHTAVAAQQHAVPGWHVYLRELGTVTALLPGRPRFGGAPLDRLGIDLAPLIASPPLFSRLEADASVLVPQRLMYSAYNTALTAGARRIGYNELVEALALLSRPPAAPSRRFSYAYWPGFDSLAHQHGIASEVVALHFAQLDQLFAQLLERLAGTNTLVVVTADHGFVDTRPEHVIRLEEHPELHQCLALPLSGEARAAYCYVRHGRAEAFERYVRERLGDKLELHASAELIEAGWFGRGPVSAALRERVGDYVLIGRERYLIRDQVLGQHPFEPIGVHGGVSAEEMTVPLVVARP